MRKSQFNQTMIVYVVMREYPYEGESLEAIFISEARAKEWISTQKNSHRLNIEEKEVLE